MPYDPKLVAPMRAELTQAGVTELTDADQVDAFMAHQTGTSLLFVNSVCGCAAGSARPGLLLALTHDAVPDRVATVFAGVDMEATARAREYLAAVPPSSPSIALVKDQALVWFMPRHAIEGRLALEVGNALLGAFEKFCRNGEPAPSERPAS